jgi:hypothetical protein
LSPGTVLSKRCIFLMVRPLFGKKPEVRVVRKRNRLYASPYWRDVVGSDGCVLVRAYSQRGRAGEKLETLDVRRDAQVDVGDGEVAGKLDRSDRVVR